MTALALAVLATAEPGRSTFVIPLQRFSLGAGSDLLPLVNPEAAVRRVARILQSDLALPLPARITLRLYDSPARLEHGLVHDAGVAPSVAAGIGGFAAGVTFEHELLLLETESRRGARQWLRLVAHEMTHLAQIELAGGEGRGAQWLAEGMAEWVALDVLDRLRLRDAGGERSALMDAVRAHLRGQDLPVDLGQLDDPLAFYDRARRSGVAGTYQLSLALTDRLIARHGLGRVVEYFRAFGERRDRAANFQRAFGRTLDDFGREAIRPAGLLGP
jgi:hypothetical protein